MAIPKAVTLAGELRHLNCIPEESRDIAEEVDNVQADEVCVTCGGGFEDDGEDDTDVPTEGVQGP